MLLQPIFLMLIIVWLRTTIGITTLESRNLDRLAHPAFVVATKDGKLDPIKSTRELQDFFMFDNHTDIFGVEYDVLYDPQSPTFFYPPNCHVTNGGDWNQSTIFAIVGQENAVTDSVTEYLRILFREQYFIIPSKDWKAEFKHFET